MIHIKYSSSNMSETLAVSRMLAIISWWFQGLRFPDNRYSGFRSLFSVWLISINRNLHMNKDQFLEKLKRQTTADQPSLPLLSTPTVDVWSKLVGLQTETRTLCLVSTDSAFMCRFLLMQKIQPNVTSCFSCTEDLIIDHNGTKLIKYGLKSINQRSKQKTETESPCINLIYSPLLTHFIKACLTAALTTRWGDSFS